MKNKRPSQLSTVNSKLICNSTAEFLIFTAQAGEQSIEVRYEDETVWLTQKMMAQLFGVTVPTINAHLKNVFKSGELRLEAVIRKFRTTASDGKSYLTQFYNLDAIISVGYRVNSIRATQFRQWATRVLRKFAIKGYVLDKKRLENGTFLGEDYFERLLEEIREIRLSERRFYQKVTDIYATAVDYNKDAPTTREFFCSDKKLKKKSADCAIKQGMNRLTINTEIFKGLENLIAVFEKKKRHIKQRSEYSKNRFNTSRTGCLAGG